MFSYHESTKERALSAAARPADSRHWSNRSSVRSSLSASGSMSSGGSSSSQSMRNARIAALSKSTPQDLRVLTRSDTTASSSSMDTSPSAGAPASALTFFMAQMANMLASGKFSASKKRKLANS